MPLNYDNKAIVPSFVSSSGVDFCNWCPDPHRPDPSAHPGGQARHNIIRRPQVLPLFPWQARVIEDITGKPFRPHLHCPDCFGEEFRDDHRIHEKVCVKCNSPYPPVMLVCTPEICASS
mgnify:CR=1 FL=1